MEIDTSCPVRAVIFDMDGVVFEGRNFWMDLHRRYGGDISTAHDLTSRYLKSSYETLAEVVVGELWRGKSAEPYLELVNERRYQPGVSETFQALRERGVKTAIISSGPDLLAERAQHDLGVDAFRANGIEIENGRLTGAARIAVPDGEKGTVAADLLGELGVDPAEAAAVGDSDSDIPTLKLVGTPIAYASRSPTLARIARCSFHHGELPRLLEVIDATNGAAA